MGCYRCNDHVLSPAVLQSVSSKHLSEGHPGKGGRHEDDDEEDMAGSHGMGEGGTGGSTAEGSLRGASSWGEAVGRKKAGVDSGTVV